MKSVTPAAALMFSGSVIFQILALGIMPMTKGLTQPMYTALWAVIFLIGVGLMARLVGGGADISAVLPLMAAVIPLCMIMIGIFFYGEKASMLKIGLLFSSCLMIGYASSL